MNNNQNGMYEPYEYDMGYNMDYKNNLHSNKSQKNNYKPILIAVACVLALALVILIAVFAVVKLSSTKRTTMYISSTDDIAYFRTAPAIDNSNIICTLPQGAAVSFVKTEDGNFSKVYYADTYGYVETKYLAVSPPPLDSPSGNNGNNGIPEGNNTTPSGQNIQNGNTTILKYMYVANVKHSIYLRSSASEASSSNIICEIPLGTAVGFIEVANGTFSKISYGSYVGYAKTQYLSDTPPAVYHYENTTVQKYMYVANVKHSIYLRSTASAANNSNIICEIPLGTSVGFIEVTNGTFSKIAYGRYVGYAKTKYLSNSDPLAYYYEDNSVKKYMYVANVKHSIYLRSSASASSNSNIICEIPLNTRVGFIGYANNTFSKIKYGNTVGYAKTQYLSNYQTSSNTYSSSSSGYMTVYNVKHSIYLRSTPSEASNSNIICEIPVGSTVEFIESANSTFHKIRWNGTVGYSKAIYLK